MSTTHSGYNLPAGGASPIIPESNTCPIHLPSIACPKSLRTKINRPMKPAHVDHKSKWKEDACMAEGSCRKDLNWSNMFTTVSIQRNHNLSCIQPLRHIRSGAIGEVSIRMQAVPGVVPLYMVWEAANSFDTSSCDFL